ncbi:hypothetical protein TNCT_428011 [Trichonephila clavata]|uniref:Uncharacterized protein n=1 Tax=Trichonephila clavata TaxID=2740835 RepID=A0A8X6IV96_TRICU|nr:hypothetical protein TNCT_428011 [Trichonephila clavata]
MRKRTSANKGVRNSSYWLPAVAEATLMKNNFRMKFLRTRYLSDNNITKLENSAFLNLSNLVELNLAHNNISKFSSNVFIGLSKLRSLSIQNNILTEIPNSCTGTVEHLDVNQLQSVPRGSLKSLRRLQKLWLNGNQLREIPSQALSQLPELEALDLGENKIHTVPDYAFQNLTKLVIL